MKTFMRRCIELAKRAQSRKNTPVGSVVVIDGEIAGEGIEEVPGGNNLTGHAEVLACQNAVEQTGSRRLDGATLYSTGRALLHVFVRPSGSPEISLVVYGLETPHIGGVTSAHPILTDAGLTDWKPAPRVLGGVLSDECRQLR